MCPDLIMRLSLKAAPFIGLRCSRAVVSADGVGRTTRSATQGCPAHLTLENSRLAASPRKS